MNTVALKRVLVELQVKETVVIITASVILPFVVHLAPVFEGIPLGARLLAMFYAPFIAMMLFHPHVAIITALLAPSLNSLLAGHPVPEKVAMLTLELMLFCAISYLILRRRKGFWGAAPCAFILSALGVNWLLGTMRLFAPVVITGLPGIAALALLNRFLLRFQPE